MISITNITLVLIGTLISIVLLLIRKRHSARVGGLTKNAIPAAVLGILVITAIISSPAAIKALSEITTIGTYTDTVVSDLGTYYEDHPHTFTLTIDGDTYIITDIQTMGSAFTGPYTLPKDISGTRSLGGDPEQFFDDQAPASNYVVEFVDSEGTTHTVTLYGVSKNTNPVASISENLPGHTFFEDETPLTEYVMEYTDAEGTVHTITLHMVSLNTDTHVSEIPVTIESEFFFEDETPPTEYMMEYVDAGGTTHTVTVHGVTLDTSCATCFPANLPGYTFFEDETPPSIYYPVVITVEGTPHTVTLRSVTLNTNPVRTITTKLPDHTFTGDATPSTMYYPVTITIDGTPHTVTMYQVTKNTSPLTCYPTDTTITTPVTLPQLTSSKYLTTTKTTYCTNRYGSTTSTRYYTSTYTSTFRLIGSEPQTFSSIIVYRGSEYETPYTTETYTTSKWTKSSWSTSYSTRTFYTKRTSWIPSTSWWGPYTMQTEYPTSTGINTQEKQFNNAPIIYVSGTNTYTVTIHDVDSTAFSTSGGTACPISYHRVFYYATGNIYLYDESGRVCVYDASGELYQYDASGKICKYDPVGEIYLHDASGRVFKYDAQGNLLLISLQGTAYVPVYIVKSTTERPFTTEMSPQAMFITCYNYTNRTSTIELKHTTITTTYEICADTVTTTSPAATWFTSIVYSGPSTPNKSYGPLLLLSFLAILCVHIFVTRKRERRSG